MIDGILDRVFASIFYLLTKADVGYNFRVSLWWVRSFESSCEDLSGDPQALICVVIDYLGLLLYQSLERKTEFCFY